MAPRPGASHDSALASLITHVVVAAGASRALVKPAPPAVWVTAAVLSVAPDFDVVGFALGVRYADLWGHRGLTHSIFFAAVVGTLAAFVVRRLLPSDSPRTHWLALLFASSMASHGIFDAMTDGGLGIALLSPFDRTRYFLPFQPVEVSPLALRRFLSMRGVEVLVSEVLWIWLPVAALVASVRLLSRQRRGQGSP